MIGRPRKRPRKRSCAWRTLGWLIRREAAWCIVTPSPEYRIGRERAALFARLTTRQADRQAQQEITLNPRRQYYP